MAGADKGQLVEGILAVVLMVADFNIITQHHHCHDKGQRAEWISVAFTVLVVDKSKAR